VRQVGYLLKLHYDARSAKHEKKIANLFPYGKLRSETYTMRLMASLLKNGLGFQIKLLNQGLCKMIFLFQLSQIRSNSA